MFGLDGGGPVRLGLPRQRGPVVPEIPRHSVASARIAAIAFMAGLLPPLRWLCSISTTVPARGRRNDPHAVETTLGATATADFPFGKAVDRWEEKTLLRAQSETGGSGEQACTTHA